MQKEASLHSIATRGRTLDHAAFVYDFFEPIFMLGKQAEYDQKIVALLKDRLQSLVGFFQGIEVIGQFD